MSRRLAACAALVAATLVACGGADDVSTPRAASPAPSVTPQAPPSAIPFTDVTAEAGITWSHVSGAAGKKYLPETMGGGVALFDHDGDGDADLLLVQGATWPGDPTLDPPPTAALYRNDSAGGAIRFTDITAESGVGAALAGVYGMGVAVGDVDGDGDRDLFVTAVGEDRLLLHDGGVYVDATATAGVGGVDDSGVDDHDAWSTGAGFFDADGDGDLDLFVLRYVRWSRQVDDALDFRLDGVGRAYGPPSDYRGVHPVLWRNRGDGTFEDASRAADLDIDERGLPVAKALGLTFVDPDADGRLDIVVANDTTRNLYFRNLGEGRFEETGELMGLAYDLDGNVTGAMGIDAGHDRGDANLAIHIGNFDNEMSSVLRAQDDPEFFVDETMSAGVGAATRDRLTFGVLLFDADLDGRLDLLHVNGHVEPEIAATSSTLRYRQSAQLFWNDGVRFVDLAEVGADLGDLVEPIAGRGASRADLDGDGDLDLVLTQIDGPPRVLRNDQSTGHHWLRVRVVGATDPDAIGAVVELAVDGTVQRRRVMPTRSYLSQVEPTIHFGLGIADRVDALVVTWPDGTRREMAVDGVDRTLVVRR